MILMDLDQNLFYILPSSAYFPGSSLRESVIGAGKSHHDAERLAAEGLFAWQHQKYDVAMEVYSHAISLYGDLPFFYACRSLVNTALGDDEGAFYDYQVAKRLDFNYHNYLEWRENEGEMVDGEELLELDKKIEKKAGQLQLHINRALLLVQHFNYKNAVLDYTVAISLEPSNVDLYIARGAVYLRMLRYDLALQDFNKAIAIGGTSATAYLYRGKLFVWIREYNAALADFECSLSIDPLHVAVYEERAQFYESQDNLEAALADYTKLIDLVPDDFYIYTMRADILERNHNLNAALEDYDKAIAINPHYSDLYQYRGVLKERIGDNEGARLDFEKFEELEGE
ncbi:tetratricopeptide repeat protein [Sphingobacterium alkalisoli]|uniref:Tetratricopeptide repeat protein n=2 Tax=Sphingobacterium alkalisoli TaxID=1874115 RepID=A0A4U0H5Q1_9SPHI|nr:tetratricopeptide repeat protein [Sphingobacterium alkalisoli]GGH19197.1 hypothetical protein GCM10011418_23400 [Sphingobacterium alkalisoli]